MDGWVGGWIIVIHDIRVSHYIRRYIWGIKLKDTSTHIDVLESRTVIDWVQPC